MPGKKLLLHTCCAPCSVNVAPELNQEYEVTCFFYNPNIDDPEEYEKRLQEMERLAELQSLPLLTGGYEVDVWREQVTGFESEPEGGARCRKCFALRLARTAQKAREEGLDLFATTLTVAPMKNHLLINEVGEQAAAEAGADYLPSNFKKKDGYRKSVEGAKALGLYRQNYCGCSFSKNQQSARRSPDD